MNTAHLSLVPSPDGEESPVDRIRRLQAEAHAIALDHVAELERAMETVTTIAAQIASGGDAYPAGVRDLCRRLSEDANWRANTLTAIVTRN